MSEEINRVALALWRTSRHGEDEWIEMARAAINALREPTDAVVYAGNAAMEDWRRGPSDADVVWRAMIDDILAPATVAGHKDAAVEDR